MARFHFMTTSYCCLAIAGLTIMVAAETRAGGYPDPTISLDSQIYQAGLVIEGRPIECGKGQDSNSTNVRITSVYRGPAKAGQNVLVIGLSDFQKSQGVFNAPLGPKDHLILFLHQAKSRDMRNTSDGGFTPLAVDISGSELGVRLVLRGNVHTFYDIPNLLGFGSGRSRPFIAETALVSIWPEPPYQYQSASDFRSRLIASAPRVAEWHAHLDRAPSLEDIPWLISLLKRRYVPPPDWCFPDLVAADAAKQLATLGDLSAIDQALRANPGLVGVFPQVFATPRGRDFLLDRIMDRSFPIAHRKQLASLVGMAGIVHGANYIRSATTRPGSWEEQFTLRNDSFITRIARLAADLCAAGENEVALALLGLLDNQVVAGRGGGRDPQINLDLHDAANVLRELYRRKDASDEIRYGVENAMYAISDAEYVSLNSACGPMLTRVETRGFVPFGAVSAHTIDVVSQYRRICNGEPVTASNVVLDPVDGGNAYLIPGGPMPTHLTESGGGGWAESLPLPANFKPGKYRVHYRLMNGAHVVSEGHGFEITLPQQFPVWTPSGLFATWPPMPAISKPWPPSRKAGICAAALAVPTLLVLRAYIRSRRLYRRRGKGLCSHCAYDLRFSPDRCQECGTPVSAAIAGIVRKCLAKIALTVSAILLVATVVAWLRSYHVADCWIRTTANRADSVYFSRGSIVLNVLTTASQPGWIHEHGDPQAFPRSMGESADLTRWNVLGIEYSSLSDMLIVPMWASAVVLAICGLLIVQALRPHIPWLSKLFHFRRSVYTAGDLRAAIEPPVNCFRGARWPNS